jgi:adenine phosphoribosyltransferase
MMSKTQKLDLKSFVRDVPDYPKPGILFRDLTPLMASPQAMKHVTDRLCEHLRVVKADVVAAVDARGFIFAAPAAVACGLPFIPLRKAGKLPPEVVGADYALEYGTARLEARSNALRKGQRVAIVDDLLATGGTAAAAVQLIRDMDAQVVSCAFVVELTALEGRKSLQGIDIFTLVSY